MMAYDLVGEREVGEFGLSIPTDLAIAGSVGRHPDSPLRYRPIDQYNEVWVNIATLVRNAYGSYTTDEQKKLDASHLVEPVLEDMAAIPELYQQLLPDDKQVTVVYYYNDYRPIERQWSRARLRTIKTTLQKQTVAIHTAAIETILKRDTEGDIRRFSVDLKGSWGKVALLTHQPVDLLSSRYFMDLVLLESHTGHIKDKSQWHTKFTNGKELKRIPFNKAMVQLFGDGNNLLAMYPAKIRRKVFEIAEKRRWTFMTTKEKIISNVKSEKEIELVMLLNDLFR